MVIVSHRVTLIPGDGIGPEVADATVRAVDATRVPIQIDMIIFRENTEDLYSGLEHEVLKDVVTSRHTDSAAAVCRVGSGRGSCWRTRRSSGREHDRVPQPLRRIALLKVLQHHDRRQHERCRIGRAVTGDVRRAAVNRFEHGMLVAHAQRLHLTRDVGGSAGTNEFTDAVIAALG